MLWLLSKLIFVTSSEDIDFGGRTFKRYVLSEVLTDAWQLIGEKSETFAIPEAEVPDLLPVPPQLILRMRSWKSSMQASVDSGKKSSASSDLKDLNDSGQK